MIIFQCSFPASRLSEDALLEPLVEVNAVYLNQYDIDRQKWLDILTARTLKLEK